jgi:peroxiredoxin
MPLLDRGDAFPPLSLSLTDGATLELPHALAGSYGVVLFYRGSWCPFCNAQLQAFEAAREELAAIGTRIVALSADDEETTRGLIETHGIGFPVGHSIDIEAVSTATGAFVNPDPRSLQATGFVLDPEGKVAVSVYSSGAIGRLVPADVGRLVRHLHARAGAEPTASR